MSGYNDKDMKDLIEEGFTLLTAQCYLNPHSPFSNKRCSEAVVKKILERYNPDVNAQEPTYGWTALYCACLNGNAEVVELLIRHKANPSIKAFDGSTPLIATMMHVSTVSTAHRIALALLRAHNNINAANAKGETALYHAVMGSWVMRDRSSGDKMHMTEFYGDAQIPNFLIRCGADVNALAEGSPILVRACDPESTASAGAVEILLKSGADVNARDAEGRTALMRINEDPTVEAYTRNEEGWTDIMRINDDPKGYDNYKKAKHLLEYWADEWEELPQSLSDEWVQL